MKNRWLVSTLLAGMVLLATGCALSSVPTPTPLPPRSPATPTPATPTPSPVAIPPGAEAAVAAARKHLAERLQKSEQEIAVGRVEPVDWSDSSLGCPKPGMMYAQVITPGYRIILAAGGITYEYHSGRGGNAIPCP